jgi:outer membrane protein assembly factor BamD (BamD/ComL family)
MVLLLSLLMISGCGSLATRKEFYTPITAELQKGDYTAAARQIETAFSEMPVWRIIMPPALISAMKG